MASSFSVSSQSLSFLLLSTILFAVPTTSYPLDKICKQTKNPNFCFKVLGPDVNANLRQLSQTAIDATISDATKTSAKIQSLLSQTNDPSLKTVYSLCSNYYSAALSALSAAKEKLKSGELSDLNGAANTVSRDAASCQQAFSIAPSKPIPIASDNNNLDLLANVFVVVARTLSG